jgi:hypothetical protein
MDLVIFGMSFIGLAAASLLWAADSRPDVGDAWTDRDKR